MQVRNFTLRDHSGVWGRVQVTRHMVPMLLEMLSAEPGITAASAAFAAAFISLLMVDWLVTVFRRRVFRLDEIGTPPPPRGFTHKIFGSPFGTGMGPGSRVAAKWHITVLMALYHAVLHHRSLRFLAGFMVLPLV